MGIPTPPPRARSNSRLERGAVRKPIHRSPRLPSPESSRRSEYTSDGKSPHSVCAGHRRDTYPSIVDKGAKHLDFQPSHQMYLDIPRLATPTSPSYDSDMRKPSLPSLRSILDANDLPSPTSTLPAREASSQLLPFEPSMAPAPFKPLAFYPDQQRHRVGPAPEQSLPAMTNGIPPSPRSSSMSSEGPAPMNNINQPVNVQRPSLALDLPPIDQIHPPRSLHGPHAYQQIVQEPSPQHHRPYEHELCTSYNGYMDNEGRSPVSHRSSVTEYGSYAPSYSLHSGASHPYQHSMRPATFTEPRWSRTEMTRPLVHTGFVEGPRGSPRSTHSFYDSQSDRARKRSNLPKHAVDMMKQWFDRHLVHPYPGEDEKAHISNVAGITMTQVSNWFINHRRRCPELRDRRERVYKRGIEMTGY